MKKVNLRYLVFLHNSKDRTTNINMTGPIMIDGITYQCEMCKSASAQYHFHVTDIGEPTLDLCMECAGRMIKEIQDKHTEEIVYEVSGSKLNASSYAGGMRKQFKGAGRKDLRVLRHNRQGRCQGPKHKVQASHRQHHMGRDTR